LGGEGGSKPSIETVVEAKSDQMWGSGKKKKAPASECAGKSQKITILKRKKKKKNNTKNEKRKKRTEKNKKKKRGFNSFGEQSNGQKEKGGGEMP